MQDVMWCDRMGGGQSNRNRKQNNRPASDFRPDCTRHNTSTGTRIAYRTPYISRPGRLGGRWDCEAVALHATTIYLRSQKKTKTSKQAKPARTDEQERDTHKAASTHTQQRRSQTRAGQGLGRERTLARIAAQEGSRSARPGMAEHGKEGGVGAGEAVL